MDSLDLLRPESSTSNATLEDCVVSLLADPTALANPRILLPCTNPKYASADDLRKWGLEEGRGCTAS